MHFADTDVQNCILEMTPRVFRSSALASEAWDRSPKMVVSVKAICCDNGLLVCDYEHFIRHF